MNVQNVIELQNGERVRFVLAYAKHSETFADTNRVEYVCPNCGGNVWEASYKTGTGKLNKDQVKLKCVLCFQWFIGNKNNMERVLGSVD